jgi:predicted phage-related endonuclease
MKVKKYETEEAWLEDRKGKVTGTRVKDLIVKRGTGKKIGYYELIAERIALPPSKESALDRGVRLEDEAVARFAEETGKKVDNDLVIWFRDDNENIAVSPDGSIGEKEAVEVKCLSSARHLEAFMTKVIPDEYEYQVLQYFIVNENLKKLYFVFYDPRMPKDIFWIEVDRKTVEGQVAEVLALEKAVLAEIDQAERDLTF